MASKELLLTLRSLPLFHGLPEEQLALLVERSRDRVYKPNEIIVSEAEKVRAFFLVITGRVKLYKSSTEGKEQTLYVFGPGEPFCLCTAFEEGPFPANAAALEKTRILILPGEVLEELAQQAPTLLFNALMIVSRRLKESMQLIESLSLKEIPQRLASFFLHEAGRCPNCDDKQLELDITQRELAKIIGATPETLSRALRKMSNDNLIEVKGRSIRLLDRDALENLVIGD